MLWLAATVGPMGACAQVPVQSPPPASPKTSAPQQQVWRRHHLGLQDQRRQLGLTLWRKETAWLPLGIERLQ